MMKLAIAVSVIYLTAIIDIGSSLECYSCGVDFNDKVDLQMCGDPFFKNGSLLRNCDGLSQTRYCFKSDVFIPGHPGKILFTARGCAWFSVLNFKFSQEMEWCDTDGCNSCQSLKSSAIVMIFIVMIKCLFYKFQ